MDRPREGVSARKKRNRVLMLAAVIAVLAFVTLGVSRLKSAAPRVDKNTVWVDTVRRGPMVREVRGIGVLVPREVRWIPAKTNGRFQLEHLDDVIYVGPPAFGRESATVAVFRFQEGGDEAVRTTVRFGRMSVSEIEVVEGLKPGDRIILSDTSNWDDYDRLLVN
jgi:multidrug efflux pump subunit AcrA (membrane-fusion protein)